MLIRYTVTLFVLLVFLAVAGHSYLYYMQESCRAGHGDRVANRYLLEGCNPDSTR